MATAIENSDGIIATCNQILCELGDQAKPEWKEALGKVVSAIEKLKTQFFIKTNLAIPGTKACLKDVSEIRSLISAGELPKVPGVLARLRASLEKLLSQAKMEGVSLT
jgi:hypothetical protein